MGFTYCEIIYKFRWFVLGASILALGGLGFVGKNAFGGLTDGGFVPEMAESVKAVTKLSNTIGDPDYNNGGIIVLLDGSHLGWNVDMPQYKEEYIKVLSSLKSFGVRGYLSYYEYPEQTQLVSDDRMKSLILALPSSDDIILSKIRRVVSVSKLIGKVGGGAVAGTELTEEILEGIKTAEFDTLPVLFVLLCLTTGSIVAGLTPWLIAAISIMGTLTVLVGLNEAFRMSGIASNVVTMFGLGLGIDYSLFIVSRFRDEMIKHPSQPVTNLIQRTLETSGRTVFFSAITVFLSLAGGLQFHQFFLSSMCLAVMLSAAFAAAAALSTLLAMLCIIDRNIFTLSTVWFTDYLYRILNNGANLLFGRIPVSKICPNPIASPDEQSSSKKQPQKQPYNDVIEVKPKREGDLEKISKPTTEKTALESTESDHGFWFTLGTFVTNHPIAIILLVSSALIALSVVFFVKVKFGSTDPTVLHGPSMSRKVFESQINDFSKYSESNIYVYLRTPTGQVTSEAFLRKLSEFESKVKALESVTYTTSLVNPGEYSYTLQDYITIYANPQANSVYKNFTESIKDPISLSDLIEVTYVGISSTHMRYSKSAKHLVSVIRHILHDTFPDGMLVDSGVTGTSAIVKDLYEDLRGVVPAWIAVMMIAVSLLLMIMTKSILIPIKAVVMSLLSLGATLGILVLFFQEGALQHQLDFVPNGYLDGSNLIFVVSVAFGLAVDYELFLISAIQENYLKCKDNKLAVRRALQQTGSVITSAAIMLALVTAAFLASTVSFIKLIGLGIAIAVLLDATVVRMLLVPASIVLLGDWNWYCPKPIVYCIDLLGVDEPPDWLGGEAQVVKAVDDSNESKKANENV